MIIWQVNWNPWDSNHKQFVKASSVDVKGRSKRSSSIVAFSSAKVRADSYYFYLELHK